MMLFSVCGDARCFGFSFLREMGKDVDSGSKAECRLPPHVFLCSSKDAPDPAAACGAGLRLSNPLGSMGLCRAQTGKSSGAIMRTTTSRLLGI